MEDEIVTISIDIGAMENERGAREEETGIDHLTLLRWKVKQERFHFLWVRWKVKYKQVHLTLMPWKVKTVRFQFQQVSWNRKQLLWKLQSYKIVQKA